MATYQDLKNKVFGTLKDKGYELRKNEVEEMVDVTFAEALDLLIAEGELKLGKEWGKLQVVERAARKGRNPSDGTEIEIPAKKAPKFVPSKTLKDTVKNS